MLVLGSSWWMVGSGGAGPMKGGQKFHQPTAPRVRACVCCEESLLCSPHLHIFFNVRNLDDFFVKYVRLFFYTKYYFFTMRYVLYTVRSFKPRHTLGQQAYGDAQLTGSSEIFRDSDGDLLLLYCVCFPR